jgi:hypothetical protein
MQVMTIARLRVGRRQVALSIGLEPTRQDPTSSQGQLAVRHQEKLALKELDQRRNGWDTQLLHLARRPV